MFDTLVQVLVFGCAYHPMADATVSATTLRRRRDAWIVAGVLETLCEAALAAYDRMIGLEVVDLAADSCLTVAPCGGETAGRSPVNRGKQGLKRSGVVDAAGIPLGSISAPASRPDSPLLEATLDTLARLGPLPDTVTVHLDRGYDSGLTRQRLGARGRVGEIPARGTPAPLTAGQRWVVERAHAWLRNWSGVPSAGGWWSRSG